MEKVKCPKASAAIPRIYRMAGRIQHLFDIPSPAAIDRTVGVERENGCGG